MLPFTCSGVYSPPEGSVLTLWWSSSPHSCPSACPRQCELLSRPGWRWCCILLAPWSETQLRLAQRASLTFERSSHGLVYFEFVCVCWSLETVIVIYIYKYMTRKKIHANVSTPHVRMCVLDVCAFTHVCTRSKSCVTEPKKKCAMLKVVFK